MSHDAIDEKSHFNVQRKVNGWKLDVWFWGFNSIHVIATRDGKKHAYNFNRLWERRRGQWVDVHWKDRWSIRYDADFPGQNKTYWTKRYNFKGSVRIADFLRRECFRIADMKEAARWRAEGFYRQRERRRALERYFDARKNLDAANKRADRTRRDYQAALALDKAFNPRGPRR